VTGCPWTSLGVVGVLEDEDDDEDEILSPLSCSSSSPVVFKLSLVTKAEHKNLG